LLPFRRLSLTLLVTGVAGTDHADRSVALDDLTEFASAFDRSSDFHSSNLFQLKDKKYKPGIMRHPPEEKERTEHETSQTKLDLRRILLFVSGGICDTNRNTHLRSSPDRSPNIAAIPVLFNPEKKKFQNFFQRFVGINVLKNISSRAKLSAVRASGAVCRRRLCREGHFNNISTIHIRVHHGRFLRSCFGG
jgi:hypothetical protein